MLKTYEVYHVRPNMPEQFALIVVASSARMARRKLLSRPEIQLPNGYYTLYNVQNREDSLSFEHSIFYRREVVVPASVCKMIDRYLNATSEEDFQPEDDTISYTVTFPDGVQMDIKCCGAQSESSWTEAVLFDKGGAEIGCSEPGDEFFGVWDLEDNGIRYVAEVIRGNTEK